MGNIITLLTDFGVSESYVGQMHGVIAGIAPLARVIDLTHQIAPQDIEQGAWQLADAVEAFPPGTIHVAVVDPGVGSNRRGLVAEIGPWLFVAPDNGLLIRVAERWPIRRIHVLTETNYFRSRPSLTFHGRDLFSPVAAHLATGVAIESFGPRLTADLVRLPPRRLEKRSHEVVGEVVRIDHFGNLITNIPAEFLAGTHGNVVTVQVEVIGVELPVQVPLVDCYADSERGDLVALIGSNDHVEVAENCGTARERLNCGIGTTVRVTWRK